MVYHTNTYIAADYNKQPPTPTDAQEWSEWTLNGEEWFIGSITNNEARALPVSLDFLPEGKNYVAEIYTDGERSIKTRTKVKCSRYRVNSMTKLNFELKASGGSAVRLIPEKDVNKKLGNYKKQKL